MMPMPMSMQQRQIPLVRLGVVHLRAPPCPTICVRRSRRVEERTAPRGTRSCASAWGLADTAVSIPRTPPTFTGMRTVHSEATFCSVQLVTTKLDQGSKTPRLGLQDAKPDRFNIQPAIVRRNRLSLGRRSIDISVACAAR
jgi:hypothetical protein